MHRLQSFQHLCILLVVGTVYVVEITGEFIPCGDLGGECRRFCPDVKIERGFCPGGEICCLTVERKCYKCEGATCIYAAVHIQNCHGRNLYKSLSQCESNCNDFACYKCVGGKCQHAHSSSRNCALQGLLTEAKCRATCHPMCYKCMGEYCIRVRAPRQGCSGHNLYDTLNECNAHCKSMCYECAGGTCVLISVPETGCTGHGVYRTREDCRQHCNSFRCYKCVHHKCVPAHSWYGNCQMEGLLTEEECRHQCPPDN